jgi:hypothetical protein
MTRRRRHTPEQIIRKLAEGQKLLAGDMTVEEVCRQFAIPEEVYPGFSTVMSRSGVTVIIAGRERTQKRQRTPGRVGIPGTSDFSCETASCVHQLGNSGVAVG